MFFLSVNHQFCLVRTRSDPLLKQLIKNETVLAETLRTGPAAADVFVYLVTASVQLLCLPSSSRGRQTRLNTKLY